MRFTNNHELPGAMVRALTQDVRPPYDPAKEERIGVTSLLGPPRILQLVYRHWAELEEDVSARIWALFGSAVHHCASLGEGGDDIVEEKVSLSIGGILVRGIPDLYTEEEGVATIWDYKTGTVGMLPFMPHQDWVQQLNCYALMFQRAGFRVDRIANLLLLKDWKKAKARYDATYPPVQVLTVKARLWSQEETMRFMEERVRVHLEASLLPDNQLPPCTQAEFWGRDETIALYGGKPGGRALKLFPVKDGDVRKPALAALKEAMKRGLKEYSLGYRPPTRTRCEEYCPAAPWCNQFEEARRYQTDLSFTYAGVAFRLVNEGRK